MSAELIERKLFLELADLWDVHAQYATPATRRETLRECADALRMFSDFTNGRVDTDLITTQAAEIAELRAKLEARNDLPTIAYLAGSADAQDDVAEKIADWIRDPGTIMKMMEPWHSHTKKGVLTDGTRKNIGVACIFANDVAKAIRDGDWRQG